MGKLFQWAHCKHSFRVGGQDIVDDLVLCISDKLRLEGTSELGDSFYAITEEIFGKLSRI